MLVAIEYAIHFVVFLTLFRFPSSACFGLSDYSVGVRADPDYLDVRRIEPVAVCEFMKVQWLRFPAFADDEYAIVRFTFRATPFDVTARLTARHVQRPGSICTGRT